MTTETTEELTPKERDMRKAFEEGQAWASGLKVGDKFTGALPESNSRYEKGLLNTIFMCSALQVLEQRDIYCDPQGIITRIGPRR